jgi:hypothetical protein
MAHPYQVSVLFDVPEPRILRGRLVAAADGTTWDVGVGADVWVDPVTRTAMLTPLPRTAAWKTTFTGNYARVRKSDYTGITSAAWFENPRGGTGDYYLESKDPTNESPTTSTSYPANQPMFISTYVQGYEDMDDRVFLQCGWGTEGAAGSVQVNFRANGRASVIKGGVPVGHYEWQGGSLATPDSQTGVPSSKSGRTVAFLLLPCRWNKLLVIGTDSGFEHEFSDLPFAYGTIPAITPAATFWWRVPNTAGKPSVELAPCRFMGSGTLFSRPIRLRFPPVTGSVFFSRYYGDLIGPTNTPTITVELVDATTGAAFVPNGVLQSVRIKVTMLSNFTSTPGLYSADMVKPAEATTTADAPVDVTCLLKETALEVPEVGPVTSRLMSNRLQEMDTAGVEQIQVTGDRPYAIRVGSIDITRGTLSSPKGAHGLGIPTTWAHHVSWQGADREVELNYARFYDAYAWDNSLMADAIISLWSDVGIGSSNLFITGDGFRLPFNSNCSRGEWLMLQQRGQTRGYWLNQLHDDFCKTWVRGWVPTTGGLMWYFRDPAGMSSTSLLNVYEGVNLAIADGVPLEEASTVSVHGKVEFEIIPPEANQVVAIGHDPRKQRYIWSQWDDAASQAPGTLPAVRPRNWRGRVHCVEHTSNKIQTQAVADRVRNQIVTRVGVEREYAVWSGDLLIYEPTARPLWKGDVVTLVMDVVAGVPTERGDYRIVSMSNMRLISNIEDKRPVWQVTYRALKVA